MRSELFLIPFEVGGVPIFGVGVLLALWLIAGAVFVWRQSRRADGRAEIWSNLPIFAIVAGVIVGLPSFMQEGLPIRGYGLMLVIAGASGVAMAVHRARQRGVDADTIISMVFAMFIVGIIGARLFYVIEYWEYNFADGLLIGLKRAVQFTEGGLVVYGSLIGATVAFAWFVRRQKLPMLAMADLIAPSLAVGLALGRIGCLLNGCCFGGVCDKPWAITFPRQSAPDRFSPPFEDQLTGGELHGFRWAEDPRDGRLVVTQFNARADSTAVEPGAVITSVNGLVVESPLALGRSLIAAYNQQVPLKLGLDSGESVILAAAEMRERSLPIHPTQIYSAVNAGLLGWFLWLYYPIRRRDGEVIALLLTIYPVGRFLLEIIRIDESSFFGTGLSISQNVSLVLLVAMVGFWGYLLRRPAGRLASFS